MKCECGSDAVGSPRHSEWCPKSNELPPLVIPKGEDILYGITPWRPSGHIATPGLPLPPKRIGSITSNIPQNPAPLTAKDFQIGMTVMTWDNRDIADGYIGAMIVSGVDRSKDIVYAFHPTLGSADFDPKDLTIV